MTGRRTAQAPRLGPWPHAFSASRLAGVSVPCLEPNAPRRGGPRMNSVNLIGRLARDPQLRELSQGTYVCDLRLAVDGMGPRARRGLHHGHRLRPAWRGRGSSPRQGMARRGARRTHPPRVDRRGRHQALRAQHRRERRLPGLPEEQRNGQSDSRCRGGRRRPADGRDPLLIREARHVGLWIGRRWPRPDKQADSQRHLSVCDLRHGADSTADHTGSLPAPRASAIAASSIWSR